MLCKSNFNMQRFFLVIILICSCCLMAKAEKQNEKMKLAIDGLTHQHVVTFFRSNASEYFELVGIAESDTTVVKKYQRMFGFSDKLVYESLDQLLKKVTPDAVAAFNPISEHIETVRLCAPKGIHVMVEKPLAINENHAKEMARLANQNNIVLITNYETTWYPSLQHVYGEVEAGKIGNPRKLEVRCGHRGPKEINVYPEFLEWLINPETNGAGALVDFGCYGVNIATFFNHGERPKSVSAIISKNKPDVYPLVEDEAILVLEYEDMQCIIQGSWNWPFSRKNIGIYGETGYYQTINDKLLAQRLNRKEDPEQIKVRVKDGNYENVYYFFSDVLKGKTSINRNDLSSLENNVLVVEILDAAMKSAKTGKKVKLN